MTITTDSIDTLNDFLDEQCQLSAEYSYSKALFYSSYVSWTAAQGKTSLSIQDFGNEMKTRPGITEGRKNNVRIFKGIGLLELQGIEQARVEQVSAEQAAEADESQASPKLLQIEESKLPIEEPKIVLPSNPKSKPAPLKEPAVNTLLLRLMLGTLGPQDF